MCLGGLIYCMSGPNVVFTGSETVWFSRYVWCLLNLNSGLIDMPCVIDPKCSSFRSLLCVPGLVDQSCIIYCLCLIFYVVFLGLVDQSCVINLLSLILTILCMWSN